MSEITEMHFENFASPTQYLFHIKNYIFQQTRGRTLTDMKHTHDFYEIIATLSGKCVQKINCGEVSLGAGEFIVLTPGDSHMFTSQEADTDVLGLSVKAGEFESFAKCFELDSQETDAATTHSLGEDLPEVKRICGSIPRAGNPEYRSRLLLCLLLTHLEPTRRDSGEVLPKHLLTLQSKLRDSDEALREGVKAIVALSGYSQSQLLRMVKRSLNMTLQEYCRKLRLERAYKYIISTDMSFEAVSDAVGYGSFSHFQKAFKSCFGVTPSRLRKLHSERTV